MKNDDEYYLKRKIRKSVETAFSMIMAKFGKVIKATSNQIQVVSCKL